MLGTSTFERKTQIGAVRDPYRGTTLTTIVRPPGPGSALTGRRRAFLDDPTGFLLGLQREYGDVVYFRVGLRDNYLLSHPDDVKDVLVTNQQRFHKV